MFKIKQKVITLGLATAMTLLVSSADAKLCIGCSVELPDNANFCAGCLTPQPKAAKLAGPQTSQPADLREQVLDLFSFLDEFEAHFHDIQYLNVLGKMPDVKTRFQNAAARYKKLEPRLPEELTILAQLYAAKFQLFEGMTGIMKNLRLDGGYRAALVKSSMVVMHLYNQVIDTFRAPKTYDRAALEALKKRVANIPKRTQKYAVTGKYLQLGKQQVPGGEKVMVLGIQGKRAHILYMGPSMDNNPVEGMLSLRDLEKRTTWQRENVFFFDEAQ